MAKRMTKTQKALNILASGKEITPTRLGERTGLYDKVYAVVARLREEDGLRIFTNRHGGQAFYRWAV